MVKFLKATPASYTGPNRRRLPAQTPASGLPPTAPPGPVAFTPVAAAPSRRQNVKYSDLEEYAKCVFRWTGRTVEAGPISAPQCPHSQLALAVDVLYRPNAAETRGAMATRAGGTVGRWARAPRSGRRRAGRGAQGLSVKASGTPDPVGRPVGGL